MKGDRAPDENVVPDVETKPNRRKKRPEAGSSASGTNSVEQAANSGEKGTKIEGELNEGDHTSKEKDKSEGNEAEEANGGSTSKKKTMGKEESSGRKGDKSLIMRFCCCCFQVCRQC